MADVLFYQNYAVSGDIITITLCIICWLFLGSIFTIKHKNLVVFHMGNALVCFAAVCNMTYHYLLNEITQNKVIWIYAFRAATYIALIFTFVLYIIYIANFINLKGKERQFLLMLNGVGAAVFIVAEISTPFSRLVFYIDENLNIHQNYYLDIFRFAYIYYMAIIGTLLIGNRKKFITKMYKCIRNVMMLSVGLVIIQTFFMETSVLCATFEFPILAALFLWQEKQYERDVTDDYIWEKENYPVIMLLSYVTYIKCM